MKQVLFLLLIAVNSFHAFGQGLTLDKCHELARQNFPLIKQKELLVKSKDYSVANAHSGFLPQLSLSGQVTYQSDVTKIPISFPGVDIEPLSKDQYRIFGEISQALYDGGTIKQQSATAEANAKVEDERVEVELYKVKERINQLYFGILLADAQLNQIGLLKKDLQTSLNKTEAAILNGTSFKSNADILEAELLKADQRAIEIKSLRTAYLDMLSYFINQKLSEDTTLENPAVLMFQETSSINRPELLLYNSQASLLDVQYKSAHTRNLPRFNIFLQGGYGRPGLNALLNDFSGYYIGGLRFIWNLSGFYNSNRDKELLNLNVQQLNYQKETFLFNTHLQLKQQSQEVKKLAELIEVDNKIVALRSNITHTAKAQHENGVISTNDLLRELNAEDQAIQNRLLHQIQLQLSQYSYQNISGN
jgi:outer membrane protein TolC